MEDGVSEPRLERHAAIEKKAGFGDPALHPGCAQLKLGPLRTRFNAVSFSKSAALSSARSAGQP